MRIDLRTRLHASPFRRLRTLSASCVFAIVAACSTASPDEAPGGPDQPGSSSPEGSGGELATMDRAEKDKAIERLKLAAADPLKMPPERFRTLSSDDITKIVSELSK